MKRKLMRQTITIVFALFMMVIMATPTFAATLRKGSTGTDVVKLQEVLIIRGYLDDVADGMFGSRTAAALMKLQKDEGLVVDGIYGPASQQAISSIDRSTRSIPEDVLWLARIIHAEAKGESYLGQLAVGSVVMNRVASSQFPNTVYGVIFQYTSGVPQYSPVADGSIWNQPSDSCIRAAWASYQGQKPVSSCLFFFNPKISPINWISKNRTFYTRIGGHDFYY